MGLRHIFSHDCYAGRAKAPSFNTEGWDDSRNPKWSQYAYALSLPEIGAAEPGALQSRLNGLFNQHWRLQRRLMEDGHKLRFQREPFDPAKQYVVAAFEFTPLSSSPRSVVLRLDNNGLWSYKPAGQVPRNRDIDEKPIQDPMTARFFRSSENLDVLNQTSFAGFFIVDPSLKYAPRMDAPFSLVRTNLETNPPMQIEHVHVGVRDIA
jgi:hypothetical protein